MSSPADRRPEDVAQQCLDAARQNVEVARSHLQRGVKVGEPYLRGEHPDTMVVIELSTPSLGPGTIEYPIWDTEGRDDAPRFIFSTREIFIDLIEAR